MFLHPVDSDMDVSCESCHGPGRDHMMAGGYGAIINPRENPSTCYACHQDKRAQFLLPHSHPVAEGKLTCSDCHEPHGPSLVSDMLSHNHSLGDSNCLQCHPTQRGPHVFEHEAMREGCTICHDPHGSLNQNMLKVRGPNLCLQCHMTDLPSDSNHINIGTISHSGDRLSAGTCWTAGCHTAPHGSQVDPSLRF
jgi:DmsE family decaheme c-type cytochrome